VKAGFFDVMCRGGLPPEMALRGAARAQLIVDLMYDGGIADELLGVHTAESADILSGPLVIDADRQELMRGSCANSDGSSSKSSSPTSEVGGNKQLERCARRTLSIPSMSSARSLRT